MKKNKAMRAAGVLLIATMLTTCMTAGTFAKYTTTDGATDSARVAKFGVVVTANGSLFGEEYAAADANTPIGYTGNTNTGTVQVAAAGTNVVAPGTASDQGLGFAVTGTPEVDVKVLYSVSKAKNVRMNAGTWGAMISVDALVTAENFDSYQDDATTPLYTLETNNGVRTFTKVAADDDFAAANDYYQLHDMTVLADAYYPVQFSLEGTGSTTYDAAGVTTDTLAAVINTYAVKAGATSGGTTEATVAGNGLVYEANTDLTSADGLGLGDAKITWEWAFENPGKDKADTLLGDLMAGNAFNGTVVYDENTVAANTPDTFVVPTGTEEVENFDDSTATDYNLYTALNMTITVEQVD